MTHQFDHKKRTYTLRKRGGIWYLQASLRGQRYNKSLAVGEIDQAEANARVFINSIVKDDWRTLDATKLRADPTECSPTSIRDVLDAFKKITVGEMAELSAYEYQKIMERICALTHPKRDLSEISVSEVNRDMATRFYNKFRDQYLAEATTEQDRKAAIVKCATSGRTYINKAACIFIPVRIDQYRKDFNLTVPDDVSEFRKQGFQLFKVPKGYTTEYNRPNDAVIQATFNSVRGLAETDRNVFLAFFLAVGAGLRRSEIIAAKWEWFKVSNDCVMLDSDYIDKRNRRLVVQFLTEIWDIIKPMAKTSGPVIEGVYSERRRYTFDRLSVLFRELGWETEKKIHEMRKWILSKLIEKYGLSATAHFSRHCSLTVLANSYAKYLTPVRFGGVMGTVLSPGQPEPAPQNVIPMTPVIEPLKEAK